MPQLRKMAKKIAGGDYAAFLEKADDTCYEELMLQGIVIGYAKMEREEQTRALEDVYKRQRLFCLFWL